MFALPTASITSPSPTLRVFASVIFMARVMPNRSRENVLRVPESAAAIKIPCLIDSVAQEQSGSESGSLAILVDQRK
jgi:hypothetical protein